ncbi:MAG TPA: hypothetical protein DIT96_11565 [Pseudomonas sp.]|nr:hypothetical protein [Pseudomonas sp.]
MQDLDPIETQEWLDALESVLDKEGEDRAHYLMTRMGELATRSGSQLPYAITTPYRNTIPVTHEARMPGDLFMERRIRSMVRWNALAMVVRTNLKDSDLGGHISSFASSATLYDIGFNYFFQAPTEEHGGDLVFYQGHASPGVYARAFMEGRISEEQMNNFRQEVDGNGLSSYPHPWLMPDFWQFPTVSMGLGPIQAIYQARFMKYLEARGFIPAGKQKVWCFMGDGECDEPESLGAIALAGREKLDNLIFVINCNLQRLDGPVRGNGKIIQELEGVFRGGGWNVNKVVWGRFWDPLLAKDTNGALQRRMDEVIDGEYQNYKAKDGAYVREHFFNTPELKAMVEDLSDDEIWKLNRGGHDPYKVYAAYHQAVNHKDQPTVILAKTIKGYGTGAGEAKNTAHNTKKVDVDSLRHFRDRFDIPVKDADLENLPFYMDIGLTALKLGEEARVDLRRFDLDAKGKEMKDLRYTWNRGGRDGLSLEIHEPGHAPLAELKEISDAWLSGKNVREKGFSLGRFSPDYLQHFRIALIRFQGRPVAFANLLETHSNELASLDLMRAHPEAPKLTMEFMMIGLILHYKSHDYGRFSLGMVPLSGLQPRRGAPLTQRLGSMVFRRGEQLYNFQGLRRFKDKFQPDWEPRYMAVPAGLDPLVALADTAALIAGGLTGLVKR